MNTSLENHDYGVAMRYVCVIMVFMVGCAKMSEEELWQKVEEARASNNYDSTIQVCQTLLKEYPEGKKAPAAAYLLGEVCQNGKHDFQNAVNYYHAFIKKYPDLNSTPLALFIVGFIYNNNLQMMDSARITYEDFLKRFPDHELATSAKFELANLGKSPDEIMGPGVFAKKERPTDRAQKKLTDRKGK